MTDLAPADDHPAAKDEVRGGPEPHAAASPERVYDELFVPALFEPAARKVAQHAAAGPRERVLDVGCGTGILARTIAAQSAEPAMLTGVDVNPGMLERAKSRAPDIDWQHGRAEALPVEDGQFDCVVSQFAWMLFEDRIAALREMARVARSSGRLVVAVCDAVDRSPGYAVLTELLHRLFGEKVAAGFRAPFALGDAARVTREFQSAGLANLDIRTDTVQVGFASISALIRAEGACIWTLGGRLDADQLDRLEREARVSLAPFTSRDGRLRFDMGMLVACVQMG